jgi:hypothetical protein
MGMDPNMVQLDGVVNGENVEIMRRYVEEINAKQRALQHKYGMMSTLESCMNCANLNLAFLPVPKDLRL